MSRFGLKRLGAVAGPLILSLLGASAALCKSSPEAWYIEQTTPKVGRVTSIYGPDRAMVKNFQLSAYSLKPFKTITVVSEASHKYLVFEKEQWSKELKVLNNEGPDDPEASPWQKGETVKICGRNCTRWFRVSEKSELPCFKRIEEEYCTSELDIAPEVLAIAERLCGDLLVHGYPLRRRIVKTWMHEGIKQKVVLVKLDTIKMYKLPIKTDEFEVPGNYKLAKDEMEVLMPAMRSGKLKNNPFDDDDFLSGANQKFGNKESAGDADSIFGVTPADLGETKGKSTTR